MVTWVFLCDDLLIWTSGIFLTVYFLNVSICGIHFTIKSFVVVVVLRKLVKYVIVKVAYYNHRIKDDRSQNVWGNMCGIPGPGMLKENILKTEKFWNFIILLT